jgi:hypothetical protein
MLLAPGEMVGSDRTGYAEGTWHEGIVPHGL